MLRTTLYRLENSVKQGEMNSAADEGEPSKRDEAAQDHGVSNTEESPKTNPAPAVDYRRTGARPKEFPPQMAQQQMVAAVTDRRKYPSSIFSSTKTPADNKADAEQTAEQRYNTFQSIASSSSLFANTNAKESAISTTGPWGQNTFGDPDDEDEQQNSAETELADPELRQQTDELFAQGVQWREYERDRDDAEESDTESAEQMIRRYPGDGCHYDKAADTAERENCAYCGRRFLADFLPEHASQCLDNPDVVEERRDSKQAMEATAIAAWRGHPNPEIPDQPQSNVIYVPIANRESAANGPNQSPIWSPETWTQHRRSVEWSMSEDDKDAVAAAATAATTQKNIGFRDDSDDAMIPCEFCCVLLPVYAIQQHQQHCDVRN